MNKISAIIIDDEAPARTVIRQYLQDFPDIEITAECSNGFDGLKQINALSPDLIFLDIQMPKLTGFEMLEIIDEPPVVIFSTAFDQYALKAFEVSAADYLLKPYSKERFAEAVKRAKLFLQDQPRNKQVISDLLKHKDERIEFLKRVVVKTGHKIHLIPVEKLLWLEAQDDYVMLHTKDGSHLKAKTMKFFEANLDPNGFVRIHRSYIVRTSFISRMEVLGKDSYRAVLQDGTKLKVSKRGYARLSELMA